MADIGSLPEADLASVKIGRDGRKRFPRRNVRDAVGNGDIMIRAQARGAEHLAQAPSHGPQPDDRDNRWL